MDDYKPNSNRFKEQQQSKNEVTPVKPEVPEPHKKVVKNAVKVKKKGPLAELFAPDDVANARDYIIHDILIPLAKKGLSDTIDSILYPDGRGRSSGSQRPRVSYSTYYDDRDRERRKRERERDRDRDRDDRTSSRRIRTSRSFENVVFDSKRDATDVFDELDRAVGKYGSVTLREFYEMVDIPGRSTDVKYGWTDLRDVEIVRDGRGWSITLPNPEPLD